MLTRRASDSDMLLANIHKTWRSSDDVTWCDATSEKGVAPEKTEKLPPATITTRTTSPAEAVAQLRDRFRLSELEHKYSDLALELSVVKASLSELKTSRPQPTKLADPAIADVLAITSEMFPGKVDIELEHDPSDPDDIMVVLNVASAGDVEAVIDREIEWHRRVDALEPRCSGQLRIIVSPIL